MHNAEGNSILNCALDTLCFLHRGAKAIFVKKQKNQQHRLTIQAFLLVALFELQTPANDGTNPGDFDGRAEMSMRVQKGGLMDKTL